MINKNNFGFIIFLTILSSVNLIIVGLSFQGLSNNYALGKHTLSIFIQLPFLTFVYLISVNFFKISNNKSLVYTAATIIPSLFLLSKFFFNELNFFEEDNLRYDLLAKYYLENKTLVANSAFTIQPGYSYYLTLLLFFFDDQSRLSQILNIFICFVSIVIFLNFIKNYNLKKIEKYFIYYLIFASTFFLSKNIIFCISEWLYLSIIFSLPVLLIKEKYRTIALLLGFSVLIRTNYVIVITFLSIIIFFFNRRKINLIIYFIIILSPFFHNLIFHKEYALFITDQYVDVAFHYSVFQGFNEFLEYSSHHLLSYFALSKNYLPNHEWLNTSFFIAILSLPFFSFYFIYKFFKFDLINKIIFVILFTTTVGVTYLFGWAYYPRFQITNYLTIFVILICINILKDRYKYLNLYSI